MDDTCTYVASFLGKYNIFPYTRTHKLRMKRKKRLFVRKHKAIQLFHCVSVQMVNDKITANTASHK